MNPPQVLQNRYSFMEIYAFPFQPLLLKMLWINYIMSLSSIRKLSEWVSQSCSAVSDSLRTHGLQPANLLCPWGFPRQEYWSGLPCLPPGDLPDPGIEPRSPALQVDALPSEPPGKTVRKVLSGQSSSCILQFITDSLKIDIWWVWTKRTDYWYKIWAASESVLQFSSVQFSRSVVSDSLRLHESQHARPPCPSPTLGVHSDSRPSSQWCHPDISSSVVPLLLLPPIPPSIRVFPNESTLRMR